MKIYFLFLFILFLAVLILPKDCFAVNDTLRTSNCESLGFVSSLCGTLNEYSQRADWSVAEEKRYLLNIFAEGGIMPKHDFIRHWNEKLVFGNQAPNNKSMEVKKCFDNQAVNCIDFAWLKTFSLMPSIIENSTFFIDTSGDVQTGYYYELNAPPTDGYPNRGVCVCDRDDLYENDFGDCGTEFEYEDLSIISISMNGEKFYNENSMEYGQNIIESFPVVPSETNTFSSKINIKNRIWRDHYGWDSAGSCDNCCRRCKCDDGDCGCCNYADRYECNFKKRDHIDEPKTISHSFEGEIKKYEKPSVSHNIVLQNVEVSPEGFINSNAKNYKLFMNNALLHKAGSKYPIQYFYEPYNILFLEKVDDVTYFVEDLYVIETANNTINFQTATYNLDLCSFVTLWPFDYNAEACVMFKKATTELDIEIDQKHHNLDEDINVEISFDSDDGMESAPIIIEYGDFKQEITVNGHKSVKLKPQEGYKAVYAYFKGDSERSSAEAIAEEVYASDDTFSSYIGIALIFLVVYSMAFFTKKYLPG